MFPCTYISTHPSDNGRILGRFYVQTPAFDLPHRKDPQTLHSTYALSPYAASRRGAGPRLSPSSRKGPNPRNVSCFRRGPSSHLPSSSRRGPKSRPPPTLGELRLRLPPRSRRRPGPHLVSWSRIGFSPRLLSRSGRVKAYDSPLASGRGSIPRLPSGLKRSHAPRPLSSS